MPSSLDYLGRSWGGQNSKSVGGCGAVRSGTGKCTTNADAVRTENRKFWRGTGRGQNFSARDISNTGTEVAGFTFSDSDSAPVPKFLNPGSVSSEIFDLCEISDLLSFVSYFASQNTEIMFGNCFFGVCCVIFG